MMIVYTVTGPAYIGDYFARAVQQEFLHTANLTAILPQILAQCKHPVVFHFDMGLIKAHPPQPERPLKPPVL